MFDWFRKAAEVEQKRVADKPTCCTPFEGYQHRSTCKEKYRLLRQCKLCGYTHTTYLNWGALLPDPGHCPRCNQEWEWEQHNWMWHDQPA